MIAGVVGGNELRALMGRFPAGVAVVTVDLDGKRAGLTVASLVSLSLELAATVTAPQTKTTITL